jgi:hypothetical protein
MILSCACDFWMQYGPADGLGLLFILFGSLLGGMALSLWCLAPLFPFLHAWLYERPDGGNDSL